MNRGRKLDDRGRSLRVTSTEMLSKILENCRIEGTEGEEGRSVNPSLALRKEKRMTTRWQK